MSDSDLTWAVEAISAHIALLWTVQHWKVAESVPDTSLAREILDFAPRALGSVSRLYPIFRNMSDELRWLVLFKGLIAAKSHSREVMLSAIDSIRTRQRMPAGPTARLPGGGYDIDPRSEALAAIANALNDVTR